MSRDLIWEEPKKEKMEISTINKGVLLSLNKRLSENEIVKIVNAFEIGVYDMASEYTWTRTINQLKQQLSCLGDEFILEMLERSADENLDDIPARVIIALAADLGLFNKTGRLKLLQMDELIKHYITEVSEEMGKLDAINVIANSIKYVLSNAKDDFTFSFNNFRNNLKDKYFTRNDDIFKQLSNSPYFHKRTAMRTFLSLIKKTQSAELETVFSNMQLFIPEIWNDLLSEDRWPLGYAYAEAMNAGNKNHMTSLRAILMKVKGFDYVPENLRSISFSETARNLLDTHMSENNFYKEPAAAQKLLDMGSSIPSPAVGICMRAVLSCKLGNAYSVSWDAQSILDKILDTISEERWKYYLNEVLLGDEVILYKLTYVNEEHWKKIIEKYNLQNIAVENKEIKKLIKYPLEGKSIKKIAKKLYDNMYDLGN